MNSTPKKVSVKKMTAKRARTTKKAVEHVANFGDVANISIAHKNTTKKNDGGTFLNNLAHKMTVEEVKVGKKEKVKISHKVTRKKQVATQAKKSDQKPMTLSPYRFPIIRSVSIATYARYIGVAFITFGGALSLYNFQFIGDTYSVHATKQVATLTTATNGTTYTTENSLIDTTTSGTATPPPIEVDETPEAVIRIDAPSPFKSVVPVTVIVPMATEVKILATNRQTNANTIVGNAQRTDSNAWTAYWVTTSFPDGEYRLTAIIKNQYGNYEHKASDTYVIDNVHEVDETFSTVDTSMEEVSEDVATTSSLENANTETVPVSFVPQLLISEASPVGGDVRFIISAQDATHVTLHAKNSNTQVLQYIGTAKKTSDTTWRLDWNSTTVVDGLYKFFARVFTGFGTTETTLVTRDVRNNVITALPESLISETGSMSELEDASETPIVPQIIFSISKQNPITNFVELNVHTTDAYDVEFHAMPKSSLKSIFIGRASSADRQTWKYAWNTTQSPNGDYAIFAVVKNAYGTTESSKIVALIRNEISTPLTSEQEQEIDQFREIEPHLIQEASTPDALSESASMENQTAPEVPQAVYIESVADFIKTIDDTTDILTIETLLVEHRSTLDELLSSYARALRHEDNVKAEGIIREIEDLREKVITSLPKSAGQENLTNKIDSYISKISYELKELTQKNESIIKERVGAEVHKDSDGDGITDFDEINVFLTSPYSADTDGDGYIDSAELTLGFNPHDSSVEAYTVYESAKETGIVREDILEIENIVTIEPFEEAEHLRPTALISGKALPNSFVTLYIYSTPIVVTVKTDETGSWNYIFDKELDDGEHEIYVGMTDNAGKIIAKSNPFTFVKTAEAFAGNNTPVPLTVTSETPSFLDTHMMLLVASMAVVALGLVLLLLGMHVSRYEKHDAILSPA